MRLPWTSKPVDPRWQYLDRTVSDADGRIIVGAIPTHQADHITSLASLLVEAREELRIEKHMSKIGDGNYRDMEKQRDQLAAKLEAAHSRIALLLKDLERAGVSERAEPTPGSGKTP